MFHEYNNKDVKYIKYIKNINESCVGHSAEGYAKVTNKPGIILTTRREEREMRAKDAAKVAKRGEGAVRVWQKLFFNSRFISTDNHNPDFSKIAEAYGIKSFKLGKHNLMNLENYLEEPGPILFDCDIEPDICLPLVAPGAALDDVIYNKPETFDFKGEAPC